MTPTDDVPPAAEETERAERQPGAKGHPHGRGASGESPGKQPAAELESEGQTQDRP